MDLLAQYQGYFTALLQLDFAWTSKLDVPTPPEGGEAQSYEGKSGPVQILVAHFKSQEREGYEAVVVHLGGPSLPVFETAPTMVRLHPHHAKAMFEKALAARN